MTPRRMEVPKKLRVCAYCAQPIGEQRPPFLLSPVGGHIVGPFHAGCAEKVKIESQKRIGERASNFGIRYGDWPSRREETLPW